MTSGYRFPCLLMGNIPSDKRRRSSADLPDAAPDNPRPRARADRPARVRARRRSAGPSPRGRRAVRWRRDRGYPFRSHRAGRCAATSCWRSAPGRRRRRRQTRRVADGRATSRRGRSPVLHKAEPHAAAVSNAADCRPALPAASISRTRSGRQRRPQPLSFRPQPRRNIRHAVAAVPDLLDDLFLELRGKSLCTHKPTPMLKG